VPGAGAFARAPRKAGESNRIACKSPFRAVHVAVGQGRRCSCPKPSRSQAMTPRVFPMPGAPSVKQALVVRRPPEATGGPVHVVVAIRARAVRVARNGPLPQPKCFSYRVCRPPGARAGAFHRCIGREPGRLERHSRADPRLFFRDCSPNTSGGGPFLPPFWPSSEHKPPHRTESVLYIVSSNGRPARELTFCTRIWYPQYPSNGVSSDQRRAEESGQGGAVTRERPTSRTAATLPSSHAPPGPSRTPRSLHHAQPARRQAHSAAIASANEVWHWKPTARAQTNPAGVPSRRSRTTSRPARRFTRPSSGRTGIEPALPERSQRPRPELQALCPGRPS